MTPRLVFDANALSKEKREHPPLKGGSGPHNDELIYEAAEYKAEYNISFSDCFVLACAVRHAGPAPHHHHVMHTDVSP